MLARLRKNSNFWWAIAPALLIVLVIWYQFGFSLGGMIEEWDQLWLIQKHPSVWTSFPGQAWSELFAARPLQAIPVLIAHKISDNSFFGFHLILMAACALRIVGGTLIGFFLFRNRAYATALGVLFLVYPADTQQFEFRTIHISMAIGIMVFASGCALSAILANTSRKRWSSAVVSASLSVIAVLIYEPVFTLYALVPLVLLARYGTYRLNNILRIRRWIAVVWLIGPILNAAYLYYAIVIFKSAYQVTASRGNISKSIIGNIHYLIDSGAYRTFFDAWVSAWIILTDKTSSYGYLVVVALVVVVMLTLLSPGKQRSKNPKRLFRYIFTGVLLSTAGYMPYMVAETHVVISQRTFMAVAPGASIIVIALISAFCRRSNLVGAVVASGVVLLGLVSQIYQFDSYTRDYVNIVRPYTSFLADATDPTKRVHLVFDTSGLGGHLNGMYKTKVQYAPEVRRRENDGEFILCMNDPQSQYILFAKCTLNQSTWNVRNFDGTIINYPAGEVQIINVGEDFNPLYRSHLQSWRDEGVFTESDSIFETQDPHAYQCVADSMWGYSRFCRGEGWSDGLFNHDHFRHVNYFLAISKDTSLIFSLSPSKARYVLKAAMFGPIRADLLSQMKIVINGTQVNIRLVGHELEANVPGSLLKNGQNKIEFLNVLPEGWETGLALSRVDLAPEGSASLGHREDTLPPVALDQWREFGKEKDIRPLLQSGFSATEAQGIWTDGKSAQIMFVLPKNTGPVVFVGEAIPFFNEHHTHLNVAIEVNGVHVLDKSFNAPAKRETFEIPLAINNSSDNQQVLITFTFDETAQPGPQDKRDLALFFERFKIVKSGEIGG
jgi:hypothetical protein